ncbi:MAG: Maf family protein [Brevinemataceae bacterium]
MIVLASGSEGRKELFQKELKRKFITYTPGVLEDTPPETSAEQIVQMLAERKLKASVKEFPKNYCICAFDTVVECNGLILGKPNNTDHAHQMLFELSGKVQRVWTGYAFSFEDQYCIGAEYAELILDMNKTQIEDYISRYHTEKFAGAYAVQKDDTNIKLISGSIDTVIGAPMYKLKMFLQNCSILSE